MKGWNVRVVFAMTFAVLMSVGAFAQGVAKSQNVHIDPFFVPVSSVNLKTAEIAAYMPEAQRLFVVGEGDVLEIVKIDDQGKLEKESEFNLEGEATSVTVFDNFVAVSLLSKPAHAEGFVEILKFEGSALSKVATYKIGHHPDMITFTPDGKRLLVACEGEPSEDGKVDPKGSVAILELGSDFAKSGTNLAPKISILEFDDASVEPEYISVSEDSKYAWVSLQENNALARVDIEAARIDTIFDLGYVDHSKPGFGLDAVKDGRINIKNENMRGLRQPDGIKVFSVGQKNFVITANEGESLENPAAWKSYARKNPCEGVKGCKVSYGSRSVSIFDGMSGELIWDSGDALEQAAAKFTPEYFNWNSKKGKKKIDTRSDDKGCEPENVTYGMVNGKRLVFVGLERAGAIAVFDATKFKSPKLIQYIMDSNHRGPEGILIIPSEKSPVKHSALLVVGFEYSKTLVVYKVNP